MGANPQHIHMDYDLFKLPIQIDTLSIVQYLYSVGIEARPKTIVERNHAPEATTLAECIRFYEARSGIDGIVAHAAMFKRRSPSFRIAESVQV